MIIDFSVSNFLSINDEISLSFTANNKKSDDEVKIVPVDGKRYDLYTFTAIYGPNASGKTNIIKALSQFINLILYSHRSDLDQLISAYQPFRLDKKNSKLPVSFEIEFIVEDIRYIYSIEFNEKAFLKEELHFFPEGRKAILFIRENENVKYGSYFTGEKKNLETFLLPNRLFLSVVANSKNNILNTIYRFFRDSINIHVRMDSSDRPFHSTTFELRDKEDEFKDVLLRILKAADLSVADIRLDEDEDVSEKLQLPDDIPDEIRKKIINDFKYTPLLGHNIFDNGVQTNEIEYFDLDSEESTGTIKMYDIAGEVIAALKTGKILIIDEFNSGLHPLLNKFIIELFTNEKININNSQLLISTHDTCALDLQILKREQIWFTDKKKDNSTDLYSLDEFDKNVVREKSRYSKMYLDGRFKAIPTTSIGDLIKGIF